MIQDIPDGVTIDITCALPGIVREGLRVARHSCNLSKTKLRKLELIPSPWTDPRYRKPKESL